MQTLGYMLTSQPKDHFEKQMRFSDLYLHFSAGKVHPLEHSADVDDDGLGELLTFTI